MKRTLRKGKAGPLCLDFRTHALKSKLFLASILSIFIQQVSAQDVKSDSTGRYRARDLRTWSVEVYGGVLTPHTVFWSNKQNDFSTPTERFGYGLTVKKQIIHSFGLQANVMSGHVKGLRAVSNITPLDGSSYNTKLNYYASITGEYTFVNFKMNKEFGLFGMYLKSGMGYSSYNVDNQNSGNTEPGDRESFIVPAGLGLKIGLIRGINLDLGYTVNFVKSDRFDGYNDERLGNTYDKFSFGHAGLEFAIGNRKKHQLSWYNPSAGGGGKPYDDSALKRAVARLDSLQKEDRARYDRELGDADHDGVANKFDKCPNTPDSVRVDGSGCPLPKFAADILKDAFDNLEFEFAKSQIKSSSYPSLDKLAGLLINQGYTLKISGHTDAVGSDKFNLKLSKDRAEAVKQYLVSKGANASKIEATGYGEFQPIATNDTPEGRARNRRVELTLY